MESRGFSTKGTLAVQKSFLVVKCMRGECLECEKMVLAAVDLSGCLHGNSKVELGDKAFTYKVTFDLNGTETLSKQVDNLKVAYEWLLSLGSSSKQGTLAQGLRKAQQVAKPAVALEKAADTLSSEKPGDLQEMVSSLSGPPLLQDATDMTADFMKPAPEESEGLPPSCACIHKGSMCTFTNLCYKTQDACALLLGKPAWNGKWHVTNFVLSMGSLQELMDHSRVLARCKALNLNFCGAIMSGTPAYWDDRLTDVLKMFSSSCECPLFIHIDFSKVATGKPHAWELFEGECRRVSIQWTTQPREVQKRLLYNLCWLEDFGVSHLEHATKRICAAVLAEVLRKSKPHDQEQQLARMVFLKRIEVPADGMCGWHALLAGHDIKRFEGIYRQKGVPVNLLVAQDESKQVKEFHQQACKRALEEYDTQSPYFRDIQRVQSHPAFGPADLRWISYVLSTAIRVTCSTQARATCQLCVSKYVSVSCTQYTQKYMCIYIVI